MKEKLLELWSDIKNHKYAALLWTLIIFSAIAEYGQSGSIIFMFLDAFSIYAVAWLGKAVYLERGSK